MSAAAQQQKAAASTSAAGAEQEEVEHGPFPIEQLQVRTRLPSPSALTLADFLGPVLVPLALESVSRWKWNGWLLRESRVS
jgi:hypothetical protein